MINSCYVNRNNEFIDNKLEFKNLEIIIGTFWKATVLTKAIILFYQISKMNQKFIGVTNGEKCVFKPWSRPRSKFFMWQSLYSFKLNDCNLFF